MGADALEAVSDYAQAVASGDPRKRGIAAHVAGRAVLDLAAYAEELEGRVR
jgi:predicted alternative tryptophan synthase beta-subunit